MLVCGQQTLCFNLNVVCNIWHLSYNAYVLYFSNKCHTSVYENDTHLFGKIACLHVYKMHYMYWILKKSVDHGSNWKVTIVKFSNKYTCICHQHKPMFYLIFIIPMWYFLWTICWCNRFFFNNCNESFQCGTFMNYLLM